MRRGTRAPCAIAGLLLLAACGGPGTPATTSGATRTDTGSSAGPTTVTVLAAASLTEAFTDLADAYENDHPGVTIRLSFGSSSTLAQQVAEGAEADVYASAGTGALDQLPAGDGESGGEAVLTRNVLEIAVQPGNPGQVSGLRDFARDDIDTVLCAETVPCGMAADEVFAAAGIIPAPASREIDVKATLAKVELREADAAMVYRSDVVAADDAVEGIRIPDDQNVSLDYPIVWFNEHEHTVGFVELATGPRGEETMATLGFAVR